MFIKSWKVKYSIVILVVHSNANVEKNQRRGNNKRSEFRRRGIFLDLVSMASYSNSMRRERAARFDT